jgi:hypothetical protein
VVFDVRFCCFSSVMGGVMKMPLCSVGMMRCHFVFSCFVVLCSLPMMVCGVIVVFGSLAVMVRSLFGHLLSLVSFVNLPHLSQGTGRAIV